MVISPNGLGIFCPLPSFLLFQFFFPFFWCFFFGWGSLTRNKLHVFHDGGIYIASQEQLWVFWFLLWKSRDSKIYFRTSQRREESLRSIWRLVRDLHSVGKFTQKVSRILQDYKKIAKKIIEFFTPKIYTIRFKNVFLQNYFWPLSRSYKLMFWTLGGVVIACLIAEKRCWDLTH